MKICALTLAAALTLALAPIAAQAIPHASAPVNVLTKDSLIPLGTFIRIRMLTQLSSSYSHAGDMFSWVVSDDVLVGKRVVIPAGTLGFGRLTRVDPAHGGNTPGFLRLNFFPIALSDGMKVDVQITRASVVLDQNEKNGYAPAAESVASIAIPYFFLFDAIRKGPDQVIQKNAVFHVAVTEDVFVQPAALAVSATPPPPSPAPSAAPSSSASPAAPEAAPSEKPDSANAPITQ